jgi:N-acetylmuramate 1-kinase
MQASDPRHDTLLHWLHYELGLNAEPLIPASSDASFRRYFRFSTEKGSRIAMDAPPPQENILPFLNVAGLLKQRGVSTPEIFAANPEDGFIVLEDFGNTVYLDLLNPTSVETLYGKALETLLCLQTDQEPLPSLPEYDEALLRRELRVFTEWCIEGYLQIELTPKEETILSDAFNLLISSALDQPKTLVHRDFHSRNLMALSDGRTGVLDFQDAVIGPITYDLVSLLRDCYVAWPLKDVERWIEAFRNQLIEKNRISGVSQAQFRRWFDLMGMQRHLKAAGIFCRLKLRDGKPGYIADIPRTLGYILDVAREQPDLTDFANLIIRRVLPTFLKDQTR